MKILIIGDHPPPFGGISVHVEGLASLLRRRGHDVRLLDVGRPRKRVPPTPELIPAEGAVQVAQEILTATSRGYLVHVHICGHNVKSWLLAAAATNLSVPWAPSPVITVHSGLAPAYLTSAPRRWLARLACRPAGRVLCVNDEIARSLRRAGVRPGRLELLAAYLPASAGRPPPALAELRARCSRLACAALGKGPVYGADLLLQAFARARAELPGLGLALFGAGAGPELEAQAHRQGQGQLLALGELSHPEAVAVIAASDVFVRPTLADGDSNSVREALALGVPVLATSVVQRPEGVHCAAPEAEPLAGALVKLATEGRRDAGPRSAGAGDRLLEIYHALVAEPLALPASRAARLEPVRRPGRA